MGGLHKLLYRFLHPRGSIIAACAAFTVAADAYVFVGGHYGTLITYAIYLFSAYSLIIVCIWLTCLLKPKIVSLLHSNALIHRYLTDVPFRTVVMLYWSLALGILYAVMKFVLGVYYRSNWFTTLSLYYLILTLMRFLLLKGSRVATIGDNLIREYRQYRQIGVVLLMNFALTGIVVLYIHQNQSFHYAGPLIFIMAFYAFYAVITAIRSLIVYRRHGSPVLSAAKVIGFAAALISMLALETAMLTQFGSDDDGLFRYRMVGATGAVISAIFSVTAIYMIVRASRQLNKLQALK